MEPNLHKSDIQTDSGSPPVGGSAIWRDTSPDTCIGASRPTNARLPTCMNRAFTLIELLACQPSLLRRSSFGYEGRKPWRRQARSAFTLIELLVVTAIIAILGALLLPALSTAKKNAQTAIDLNNVHQILMAAHLYANDNNDFLPQPGEWQGNPLFGGVCIPGWVNGCPFPVPPTGGGIRDTYDTFYPQQLESFRSIGYPRANACQFVPYLKNEKVLRCPMDIPNPLMYQRQMYISSYVWNFSIIESTQDGADSGGGWRYTLRFKQFNADDILMWESDELAVTNSGAWDNTCSQPNEGISGRHGKVAIVGNADGSAERIPLSDWNNMATGAASAGPNRAWNNPLTPDGH